ncbi:MAG: hypothetical protein JKY22_04190 [Flavobacteriaceae bacterium]|nr:hypothetical protein [Flavobacteriaceae bacterium]
MKKLLALCILAIFCVQCDSDDSQVTIEDNSQQVTFRMTMEGDFFVSNSSGKLILSDQDGAILVEAPLINNEETSLEVNFDPDVQYDVTVYFETFTSGTQFHFVNTYVDVSPGNYFITPVQGYNGNEDKITLTLTNTGDSIEVVSTSSGIITTESNSNDGGTLILNGTLPASPGFFYASFIGPNDDFPRYSWTEGVGGSYDVNVDFPNLPMADNEITVTLPTNATSDINIRGLKDGDPTGVSAITHIVHEDSYEDGTTEYQAFLPNGIFDNFSLTTSYTSSNDDKVHEYIMISETVGQTVPEAGVNFTVNNDSFANFSISASGSYDSYDVTFIYSNPDQDIVMFYDIFGEASSTVNFSKVILFNNLFADEPELIAGLVPSADRITLMDYSQVSSYEEYLEASWLYGPFWMVDETIERVWVRN